MPSPMPLAPPVMKAVFPATTFTVLPLDRVSTSDIIALFGPDNGGLHCRAAGIAHRGAPGSSLERQYRLRSRSAMLASGRRNESFVGKGLA